MQVRSSTPLGRLLTQIGRRPESLANRYWTCHSKPQACADGPAIGIEWSLLKEDQISGLDLDGRRRSTAYRVWQGTFPCPVYRPLLEALPPESHRVTVRMLEPAVRSSSSRAAVVHLPATGDHGFLRRTRLALPLLHHGVSSVLLEGPYYGARKPAAQFGSKLRHVSDLFLLGRATIEVRSGR